MSITFIAGLTPQYWTNKYNTGGASRGGGGDAGGGAGGRWGRGANKRCPFYKKMPGREVKKKLVCTALY